MADFKKLEEDVQNFINSYSIMPPEAKASFEAHFNETIKNMDNSTKNLYLALAQAAKDGLSSNEAIESMKKTNNKGKKQP
ncbi:MAG: hypothetical protein FD145_537 [Candidatus Saganbacteria bacterium]|uniref:Uncharacterized protein n=1 Tax=Candidatus Saganbacteria bacterium TaxID=2575572 RepID=A0A833L1F9_UNCSA|nr:MAG: hypothetical protein FD145_537 [Candidatus Saganbacteria bacterium]